MGWVNSSELRGSVQGESGNCDAFWYRRQALGPQQPVKKILNFQNSELKFHVTDDKFLHTTGNKVQTDIFAHDTDPLRLLQFLILGIRNSVYENILSVGKTHGLSLV